MNYLTQTTIDELKECYKMISNMRMGIDHKIFESIEKAYREMIDIKENAMTLSDFIEKFKSVDYSSLDREFALQFIKEQAEINCIGDYDLKTAIEVILKW